MKIVTKQNSQIRQVMFWQASDFLWKILQISKKLLSEKTVMVECVSIISKEISNSLTRDDRFDSFSERRYILLFESLSEWNCQFHAMSHAENFFGIYRSVLSLRTNIANYLENNENDCAGWPSELLMGMPFIDYMRDIWRDMVLTVTN